MFGFGGAASAAQSAVDATVEAIEGTDEAQLLYDEADDDALESGDCWDDVEDLTHLDRVVFLIPAVDGDDIEIVIEEPLKRYVNKRDDKLYIEDCDGVGYVIAPNGWLVELHPRSGESVFTK